MKYLLATIAALALYAGSLTANAKGAELSNIVVIDGDTLRASIDLGFGVVLKEQTIRIYGFDAWETARHRQTLDLDAKGWEQEIIKGKVAKTALETMLRMAKVVRVHEVGSKDPYGRQLLEVYADEQLVSEVMRAKGHERK